MPHFIGSFSVAFGRPRFCLITIAGFATLKEQMLLDPIFAVKWKCLYGMSWDTHGNLVTQGQLKPSSRMKHGGEMNSSL
jgi:hypothetical protein